MSSPENRTNGYQPGPNLIRTWFDTVISPLIDAQHLEAQYLEKENWTWTHYPGTLDEIRPVESYVESHYQPNYNQFLSYHSDLEPLIRKHDELVHELTEHCRELEGKILASSEYQELLETIQAQVNENPDVGPRLFAGFEGNMNEESFDYLSSYIINHRKALPSYYILSTFWNEKAEEFLKLLGTEDIHPFYKQVQKTGGNLLKQTEALKKRLTELREHLSVQNFSYR